MTTIMTTMKKPDHVLYGAAYYDEYMPSGLDRLETDMTMMRSIGINVIRIAESTWGTCESQPGVFDFSHVDRVLDAASRHGIDVIVGTPTYAVPTWLAAMHPDVMADTPRGRGSYGPRQTMDIVSPAYRMHAERVIRTLVGHVASHPAVAGYQIDNETKYYDCVSHDMQALFVKHLQGRFGGDLGAMNAAFGLDYWSNRVDAWEDFPDMTACVNASLLGEFDRFRRAQVASFLAWQAGIVREYARADQFITQNFDFDWRGHSYGVQPYVDHFKAAGAVDIAGVDIYHPGEDDLTGKEIAFGGDMARSMKDGANYLVVETQAQGQPGWLPYPGQLRLQAYSHLASGADGVMYWHWHSIHHSFETYWKGLLGHDFEPNPTYREAGVVGREIARPGVSSRVAHLRKANRVAIVVSNASLSALDRFRIETGFPDGVGPDYNDIVRDVYDALFDLNVECDFLPADAAAAVLRRYDLIVTPALYCTSGEFIEELRDYVHDGGHLVSTFRSFVADGDAGVWHDRAPHRLTDVFGMSYGQFTRPRDVGLRPTGMDDPHDSGLVRDSGSNAIIELVNADDDTTVIASYDHYAWGDYSAITRHAFGRGWAQWIGTRLDAPAMTAVLGQAVRSAGLRPTGMGLSGTVSVREGINGAGEKVTFLFNYSARTVRFDSPAGGEVVIAPETISPSGEVVPGPRSGSAMRLADAVVRGERLELGSWGLAVIAGKG
jgi:beta-galactosidase